MSSGGAPARWMLAVAAAMAGAMAGCDAPANAQSQAPVAPAAGSVAPGAPIAPAIPTVAGAGAASDDGVPVAVPSEWRDIAVAAEAGLAAARQGSPDRQVKVRTWGETGLGCFVTVVEVDGVRVEPLARVAGELQITLQSLLAVEDWTFVDGPAAEVGGRVTRGTMKGTVRGRLIADPTGVPHAAVAACFYNEREPARCQAACRELLASLEAPRVTP